MLRFQHPGCFWLLLAVLLLAIVCYWHLRKRNRDIRRIGEGRLVQAMMPRYSKRLVILRVGILLLALSIGILGMANLQSGSRTEKIERRGIDLMIALDVSKSMLAADYTPSRLERAKQLISRVIERCANDRIGLILFAGRAYVSVPLTVDFTALKMNLSTASPSLVPTQGTVIGEAISMARQSFNSRDTKYKSIILISDGEDHDEGAAEEVKKALGEGIMINTVGIGSPEGAPIYDPELRANKRDEEGKEIISKLNEKELQEIASSGQGMYIRLGNIESTADMLARQINSTEQRNFGDTIFTDYNSYFQYFLLVALVLILLEYFLPRRKMIKTILVKTLLVWALLGISSVRAGAQTTDPSMYNGNKL